VANKAYDLIKEKKGEIGDKEIFFVDTTDDVVLPWSPTSVVKIVLADQNFFKVFFPEYEGRVFYGVGKEMNEKKSYIINSRYLLGY